MMILLKKLLPKIQEEVAFVEWIDMLNILEYVNEKVFWKNC